MAVLSIVCLVFLLGFFSLINIPVDLLPEFEFPVAAVITDYEEAAPEEVETHVTRPLEEVLGMVEGVENISSISSPGSSTVLMEFTWGTDLDFALLEARESIDMVRGFLPDGAGDPRVFKFDPALMPIVYTALYGSRSDHELRRIAEDILEPRLERVEGVANVEVVGGRSEEVLVSANPELLNRYALTPGQLINALRADNYSLSAGTLQEGGADKSLRVIGEFQDLEEMERLILSSGEGGKVLLGDVGRVEKALAEPDTLSTFNGEASVGIEIFKQADANTILVSQGIWRAMEEIEELVPAGVQVDKVMDQADFIMESVWTVVEVGAVGALLALAVLLLFLRSFRSSLIVALAIPLSVVATFVLMYFAGMTLNLISLAGLALGLGIMVDSSIVVLENIFRFREKGGEAKFSAVKGAGQVSKAITAATLTTVVVFLPVVFIGGFAAEIFRDLAFTVSFSLLAALVTALTVTPLLSSRLIVSTAGTGEPNGKQRSILGAFGRLFQGSYGKVRSFYEQVLPLVLKGRIFVLILFVGVFLVSFALLPYIGSEFIPPMDQGHLRVRVTLPQGASLEETEEAAGEVEEIISQLPGVKDIHLTVGGSGMMGISGARSSVASLEVMLKDLEDRGRSDLEIAEKIRTELASLPGAEFNVTAAQDAGGGALGEAPLRIAVRGEEISELERLTEEMARVVEKMEGIREVSTSFEEQSPEVHAYVDREKASDHGLAFGQVSQALQASLNGVVATHYRAGGDEFDVRVKVAGGSSLQAAQELQLYSPFGYGVPLQEVTHFQEELALRSIERHNQVRTAAVEAEVVDRSPVEVQEELQEQLAALSLPEGYFIDFEGEVQMIEEAFADLALALLLAVLLMYFVMAVQFESLLHPLLVMFALPQTVTGAALSLLITGHSLSVPVFIGVIMLAGIVVNNSIVLIDLINRFREEGEEYRGAVLKAAPIRLRPILMTTLTTALAMFPLSLGIGSGAELWAPMAAVVIGGLLFSTLLTLIVVPAAYVLVEDVKSRLSTPGM